jgi:hypothetical protein
VGPWSSGGEETRPRGVTRRFVGRPGSGGGLEQEGAPDGVIQPLRHEGMRAAAGLQDGLIGFRRVLCRCVVASWASSSGPTGWSCGR